MALWLKKYGIAVALVLSILGVVAWVTIGMLSKPDREPVRIDPKPAEIVEKAFSVEPKAEVTVEVK